MEELLYPTVTSMFLLGGILWHALTNLMWLTSAVAEILKEILNFGSFASWRQRPLSFLDGFYDRLSKPDGTPNLKSLVLVIVEMLKGKHKY